MADNQQGSDNQPREASSTGALLAFGIEQRVMRACLLEPVAGEYRLAGWINVQRDPNSELTQQIKIVCQRMGRRLGRQIWDDTADAPLLQSEDPTARPPIHQVLAASGPRALLRVWLAGLNQSGDMGIAAEAIVAAPARIVGQSPLTAATDAPALASALSAARPDVLVLTGGFDGSTLATGRPIHRLGKIVSDALGRLPPSQYPLIIYAGDGWQAGPVAALFNEDGEAQAVEVISNVHPTPTSIDQTPLATALTQRHWHLSQGMQGFTHLERWVTSPARIVSMETAFTQSVRVWMEVHELAELHALYFASGWRLHVWSRQDTTAVHLRYVEREMQPFEIEGWPSIELISGLPSQNQNELTPHWWDRSGMMPTIATVGQISPHAMIQVLRQDLLETP